MVGTVVFHAGLERADIQWDGFPLLIDLDIHDSGGADNFLRIPIKIETTGFDVYGQRGGTDAMDPSVEPYMVADFHWTFEQNLIHFQGDHIGGSAQVSSKGGSGFIEPGEHGATEQVAVIADLTGSADFRSQVMHGKEWVMVTA